MLCLLLVGVTFVSGCGYHHIGGVGSPSEGKGGIHVRIFTNKTSRSGLEAVVTQSIIDEVAKHSGGNSVDEASADRILAGAVTSYRVAAVSYTAADRIAGYRATMALAANLVERQTGKVLWKGEISGSQDYPANADITLQQNNENAAVVEISRRLAEQLHEQIQEDF